jgi:hypothetical protein
VGECSLTYDKFELETILMYTKIII